jgi:hypothetical protein
LCIILVTLRFACAPTDAVPAEWSVSVEGYNDEARSEQQPRVSVKLPDAVSEKMHSRSLKECTLGTTARSKPSDAAYSDEASQFHNSGPVHMLLRGSASLAFHSATGKRLAAGSQQPHGECSGFLVNAETGTTAFTLYGSIGGGAHVRSQCEKR